MTRQPPDGRASAAASGPLLFQVTRTAEDTTTATYNEAAALVLLRRAARRGFGIQAQRSGGFRIEWQALRLDAPPASRLITAEPTTPARLTATMRADLEHIAGSRARRRAGGGIRIGLSQIPPGAAARLHARGLLTAPASTAKPPPPSWSPTSETRPPATTGRPRTCRHTTSPPTSPRACSPRTGPNWIY